MPWLWANTEYSIREIQHTPSTAYTKYTIHQVLQKLSITSFQDQLSRTPSLSVISHLSSFGGSWCTQLSTFPWLSGNKWIESQLPSPLPPNPPPPDRLPPSTLLISIYHGTQVHLQTHRLTAFQFPLMWHPRAFSNLLDHGSEVHTIMGSWSISKSAWSWPPSASLSSLNHSLPVHLSNCSVTASKCMSGFTQSQHPCSTPNLVDHGLQVHHLVHTTKASKWILEFIQLGFPGASMSTLM